MRPETGDELQSRPTQREQSGREGVRLGGVGQGHGGKEGRIRWLAGSRVDDVPVAPARGLEGFAPNRRDGEGFVAQWDDGEQSRTGFRPVSPGILPEDGTGAGSPGDRLEACPTLGRTLDGYLPRVGFRRAADGVHGTGAAVDQPAGDAGFAKSLRGDADGVTLANGAEIEHHALADETDRAPGGVEVNEAHSGSLAGFGESFGCRH